MKTHTTVGRRCWTGMAGLCIAALCLSNVACVMVEPVGGTTAVEAYLWTGQGDPTTGADQSLGDLAKTLSTQPSKEGELTELNRVVVIPFYEQDQMPEKDGSLPKRTYELLEPVVLAGNQNR